MLHKMVAGAVLMAAFIGLAQETRISKSETRDDRCVLEAERTEW